MREVDVNGDQEIDFEEFEKMMYNLLKKETGAENINLGRMKTNK